MYMIIKNMIHMVELREENIKTFSHGMFQSVYDYPYTSSSANHIFDITYGHSPNASGSFNTQNAKKLNIYNLFLIYSLL